MALFKISSGRATQLGPSTEARKEKDLQRLVEANLYSMFAVRFVASEFPTGAKHRGRIDTLGLDQDGSPVIIEYKRLNNQNVINQGLFYLDWLMDHRGDFELAAQKALGSKIEVAWGQPRLVLLAGAFNRYDQYAVNRIDERIELWTFAFYEGGFLRVERLDTERISSEPEKRKSKIKPGVAPGGYDLAHHVNKMSEESRSLFELLREQILALGDDVTERFMNQYIGYRRLKNFVEIVGQRKGLNLFIDGPLVDALGLGEDVSNIGHWGTGNLRVRVVDDADIEKVLSLIRQAYELQQ